MTIWGRDINGTIAAEDSAKAVSTTGFAGAKNKDENGLQQVTKENGKRVYVGPDGREYPSVTTVLGKTADKSGLDRWREGLAKRWLRKKGMGESDDYTVRMLGEALGDQVSTEAKRIGTAAHEGIERYLRGEDNQSIPLLAWAHTMKMYWELQRISDIRYLETRMRSDTLGIAGTVDCIAKFDKKLSVIDFKTNSKKKKDEHLQDYRLQLCAYGIMWNESHPKEQLRQGVNIISTAEDDSDAVAYVIDLAEYEEALKKRVMRYFAH